MKIAYPPPPWLDAPANIKKQRQVAELCYNPLHDQMLATASVGHLLTLAHEPHHVYEVQAGRRFNGFNNFETQYVLHAEKSVSAMVAASEAALSGGADGVHVAFAPASGFHHAGYNNCGGYCTFNGLMVTALHLRAQGLLPDGVLIIDGDGHYGDGTQDILLNTDSQYWVTHLSLDKASVNASPAEALARIHAAFYKEPYSLVMYQAGADAHIADPYEAGYLSDEDWATRDMTVFKLCKDLELPIVWNLAGGYNGLKTLGLHCKTFKAALQVFYPETITGTSHSRILG